MINSTETNEKQLNKSGGAFSLGRGCTSNLLPDYANASIQGPSGLSGGLYDYANAKIPGPSGLSGGLSDYTNVPASGYSGFLQASRSSIPEDSARQLFDTLYDSLVYATPEERRRAVLMLIAAYDLPV